MVTRSGSLRLVDALPQAVEGPSEVEVPAEGIAPGVSIKNGVLRAENDDGSVTVDFNPDLNQLNPDRKKEEGFFRNLAEEIDSGKLAEIATSLLDGIDRDNQSRQEWLETRARGISLLGLKLEDPRSDSGISSAPLEGMSSIRHPLLLEATIRFQATARGELLPASGPVKVRNDTTAPPRKAPPNPVPTVEGAPPPALPQTPPAAGLGHNGGPPLEDSADDIANALELDFNHYLTVTAPEYVPDTDRMLFYVGFGGDGFKKIFNCPLRRRPVSESVDAEDLIVSNASTDLRNCGRVTHRIKMRKSVLRRMQILGAYLDVELGPAAPPQLTPVDQKKEDISGIRLTAQRTEDMDYTIYETYCELDLDEFAPDKFKGEGLPLPYRVTIEKDSRKVLSVIRNWDEDDEQCLSKQFFVQFPFIRGLGFYGLGFIHVLGNTTNTLTAMWREMVDAGMYANFPGFLYDKAAGRQLSNQIRVPPGGGAPIDVPALKSIKDCFLPIPYKEVGPSFTAFAQHVEEVGQRLGQTADISIGEGKQDAPVGTTLALIEQATKVLDSVHKRLHWAQNEEFRLLKERFKEDPEAFWRHNKRPAKQWEKEQFLKALDNYNLVPVADPNNPTSLHRMAKATAVEAMASKYPLLIDQKAAIERVFRIANIDSDGLFKAVPTPPPPDPRMEAIKQKALAMQGQQEAQSKDAQLKAQIDLLQLQDKSKDREAREQLERMKIELEKIRLQEELVIHASNAESDQRKQESQLAIDQAKAHSEMQAEAMSRASDLQIGHVEHQSDLHKEHSAHSQKLEHDRVAHTQKMQHERELHAQRLEHERQLVAVRKQAAAKAKPKGK